MPKIGGKAKAMLVTASRPHVIRYKDEFDKYLKKQGYEDIKAIVAFTAFTDRETGIAYTESDPTGLLGITFLAPLISPFIFFLIFTTLLRNLVQNYS